MTDRHPFYQRQAELGTDDSLYQLDDTALAFFKSETGIQDDAELKRHIIDVQHQAFAVYPYPCIRHFGFTKLRITQNPAYGEVIQLGKTRPGAILLDLGCCFGNDARKAAADGWPATQILASDLRPEFWQLGHTLFRSTASNTHIRFVQGDIFSKDFLNPFESHPASTLSPSDLLTQVVQLRSLNALQHQVSAIHVSAFFHLFDYEQQLEIAKRLNALLSMQPGSIVFGGHGGQQVAGVFPREADNRNAYGHSVESFQEMWAKAVPDGSLKVDAELVKLQRGAMANVSEEEEEREKREGTPEQFKDWRWLRFAVRRI